MKGTRAEVFQKIYDWIDESDGPNLMWLSGDPGAGKSAIAKNLAQKLHDRGRLGASFFFQSGHISDPSLFWRTVAYHLSSATPSIRKDVVDLLKSPGNNLLDDVEFQFEQLIEKIVKADSFSIPLVIVLDALDECHSYSALLRTLERWSQLRLRCKLFLTSRPEQDIQQGLADVRISRVRLFSGKAAAEDTNNDIRLVLETGFSKIKRDYGIALEPWPRPTEVDDMVARAAGLFIWATTALKHIGDCEDDEFGPDHRLSQLASGQMRAEGVDGLYLAILDRSFKTSQEGFRAVVGTIILSKEPIGIRDILQLQGYCKSEYAVSGVLNRLSSVLSRGTDHAFTVRHQSFVDFLTSKHCPGRFFINRREVSHRLAVSCIRNLNEGLKFNICNFTTSHAFNDKVTISEEPIKKLSYSSRFWAEHLEDSGPNIEGDDILPELQELLYKRFLYWLEVMSLLKQVDTANVVLNMARKWCQVRIVQSFSWDGRLTWY
jgi:NACHT domain